MAPTFPQVHGLKVDGQTRCQHYRGADDIIAIKMKCCDAYYACSDCHLALADHPGEVWPEKQWDRLAILCGACGIQLTIRQYMQSGFQCPACGASFNPRCQNHYHLYFQTDPP